MEDISTVWNGANLPVRDENKKRVALRFYCDNPELYVKENKYESDFKKRRKIETGA